MGLNVMVYKGYVKISIHSKKHLVTLTRKRRRDDGEMKGAVTIHQDLPQLANTFLVHFLGYRRVLERG